MLWHVSLIFCACYFFLFSLSHSPSYTKQHYTISVIQCDPLSPLVPQRDIAFCSIYFITIATQNLTYKSFGRAIHLKERKIFNSHFSHFTSPSFSSSLIYDYIFFSSFSSLSYKYFALYLQLLEQQFYWNTLQSSLAFSQWFVTQWLVW